MTYDQSGHFFTAVIWRCRGIRTSNRQYRAFCEEQAERFEAMAAGRNVLGSIFE